MPGLREAAGIEGLVVLGVIYVILNILQKAGQKAARSREPEAPPPDPMHGTGDTQQEALSLESILKEIEKVKAERRTDAEGPRPPARAPAPEPRRLPRPEPKPRERPAPATRRSEVARRKPTEVTDRGPMGRRGPRRLEDAEDVEVRTSLEDGGSLEVEESLEVLDETRLRPPRKVVDSDDAAAAVVRRRIEAAEARNRPLNEADHQAFHKRLAAGDGPRAPVTRHSSARLREALVWREILGPPKALED